MKLFDKLNSNHLPSLLKKDTMNSIWFLYEDSFLNFEKEIVKQFGSKISDSDTLSFPAMACIEYSSLVFITTIYTLLDFYPTLPEKLSDMLLDTFSNTVNSPYFTYSKELYFGKTDFSEYDFINSVMEYISDCFSKKITPKYSLKLDCSVEGLKETEQIFSYMYNHYLYFLFSDRYKISYFTKYPNISPETVQKVRSVYDAYMKFTLDYLKRLLQFIRDGHLPRVD